MNYGKLIIIGVRSNISHQNRLFKLENKNKLLKVDSVA